MHAEDSAPPTDGSAGSADEVQADSANDTQAPRKRGGRRAASRPAGPPAAVFSAAEQIAEVPSTDIVVPSAAVAAVFQAPEPEVVQPRRTRKPKPSTDAGDDQDSKAPADEAADAGQVQSPKKKKSKKKSGKAPETTDPQAESDTEQSTSQVEDDATEASADTGADDGNGGSRRRRRRGGRGRGRKGDGHPSDTTESDASDQDDMGESDAASESGGTDSGGDDTSGEGDGSGGTRRRRRRRRRGGGGGGEDGREDSTSNDEVTAVKGSTRLEAKRQRRREGRASRGMRAPILTEAEFLARREAVDRSMVMRQHHGVTQIAVLEDDVLVEHYVSSSDSSSMIGNVYLGRIQNVLPSMEAAFVDIGRGRNAVLYAGEVNWDAAGLEGQPKRIELALKSGDEVMVQVTKDPVGQKGARLTSQISLPGRFLVYVPQGGMTGISRKLPDRERSRLKRILKTVVPDDAGVIVRTAAEGASEEQLRQDVQRLAAEWEAIEAKAKSTSAPAVLRSEPDLAIKVVRDIFNEDFGSLVISGAGLFSEVSEYVSAVAPDLMSRTRKWVDNDDVFVTRRVDEQLAKALDRKVWLPSGGSLVIDRTEAMTVIDVNTGKFVGKGGNLEETVTRNNLEAAEEIVRQLRLRDIGGIIVVDFIDMVLESNRELVLRRLVECLSRDRTKHQVAEVTSLGLVQMTRKRIGQGLLETFSVTCETCNGRGVKVQTEPVAAGNGGSPRVRRQRITGPIPGAPTNARVETPESAGEESGSEESPSDTTSDTTSEVLNAESSEAEGTESSAAAVEQSSAAEGAESSAAEGAESSAAVEQSSAAVGTESSAAEGVESSAADPTAAQESSDAVAESVDPAAVTDGPVERDNQTPPESENPHNVDS